MTSKSHCPGDEKALVHFSTPARAWGEGSYRAGIGQRLGSKPFMQRVGRQYLGLDACEPTLLASYSPHQPLRHQLVLTRHQPPGGLRCWQGQRQRQQPLVARYERADLHAGLRLHASVEGDIVQLADAPG